MNGALVTVEFLPHLPRGRVPDPHDTVAARRRDRCTVGGEGDRIRRPVMGLERLHRRSSGDCPDPHPPVTRRSGEQPSIRRKRRRPHGVIVTADRISAPFHRTVYARPHPHRPVARSTGEHGAIGRPTHRRDIACMTPDHRHRFVE